MSTQQLPTTPTPPRRKPKWYASPLFWTVTMVALFGLLAATLVLADPQDPATRQSRSPLTTAALPESPPDSAPVTTEPDVATPPEAGPIILKVGQTFSVDQSADQSGFADPAEGSAEITIVEVGSATREPVEYGSKAERGFFIVVRIKAVGLGGGVDVNGFDFYARTKDGFKSDDQTYSSEWGPPFDGATLNKGEKVSGMMVFDMPSRHGQIVYAPNLDGDPLAIWKF